MRLPDGTRATTGAGDAPRRSRTLRPLPCSCGRRTTPRSAAATGVGSRVSPHFYNTLDEAMACLDAMQDVLAGR